MTAQDDRGASDGPHRRADGRFYNPWPDAAPHGLGDFLRWAVLERWRTPRPADPPTGWLSRSEPTFPSPRAPRDAITATWVGHSTFLLQVGGLNVLTDPMWGERASPVSFAGPRRQSAPGVALTRLPPIDVVLQSHDHYDHLDDATVRTIARAHPDAQWFAPLGVAAWLASRGVRRVRELDWWGSATVERAAEPAAASAVASAAASAVASAVASAAASAAATRAVSESDSSLLGDTPSRGGPPAGKVVPNEADRGPNARGTDRDRAPAPPDARTAAAGVASPTADRAPAIGGDVPHADASADASGDVPRVTCLPAQHFAGRGLTGRDGTLWCGWSIRVGDRAVYFAGDSGLHPEFERIARRAGPFDLALLPIGAYAPRWFMRPVHADPADALAAYEALVRGNGGGRLVCGGMHWGTFKLTDEPMDEPPRAMRERWTEAGLAPDDLWIPRCGETITL